MKVVVILVVTIASWGVDPTYSLIVEGASFEEVWQMYVG